jgi:hypothetical protein
MLLEAGLIAGMSLVGIAATDPGGAATEYLSEHQERIVYIQQGWGDLGINVAAHARGQTALPMQIGEKKYTRGLGHHAPGEIVVELDGEYLRFEAQVGVQAQAGQAGSVVFQVFVDDEKRFDSGVMRGTDAARPVSVALAGAQEMRLVVSDAGDGITCDCADWAEARLIRDTNARPARPRDGFDVARFARVVASDPARNDGAHSTRIQEYRAEDIFLEWDMRPNERGEYAVSATANGMGMGTIGLRWIERRSVRSLAIEFADSGAKPSPDRVRVQYWAGESPYQGAWKPFNGTIVADGDRWTFRAEAGANPELRGGTWKIRWLFPVGEKPVLVRRVSAFTPSLLAVAELRIQFEPSEKGRAIDVEVYNGEIVEPAEHAGNTHARFDASKAFPLKIRYCKRRPWQAERTVLRFRLPEGAFGVAVDDVLANHVVYVPAFKALVTEAAANVDLDGCRASIAGRETILQQVRHMPDQTREQAIARVHHVEQDRQPTMPSLACDNRKFIVQRDGTVQFTYPSDGSKAAAPDKEQVYPLQFKPTFGSGKHEGLTRHLEGGWYPAPVVTVVENGVKYTLRTFVLPYDPAGPAADNPWLNAKPLCVVEIAVENIGEKTAEASVGLAFTADTKSKCPPPEIRYDAGRGIVTTEGMVMAAYEHGGEHTKIVESGTQHTLVWTLEPKQQIASRVCIPAWKVGASFDDAAALLESKDCFATFKAYWDRRLSAATQVEVPDEFMMNVIRASQVHCLLAARNEENGKRVAAWTASVSYGPLESESHSPIRGMALMGHEEFARRSLDYFIHRYDPAGFLTVGYTLMGTGWHLQTLGEYYALTQDREWLESVAPKVANVCHWIMKQREKTKHSPSGLKPLEYGLMPPGVGADWNAFAYHFCLNGYYCAGLRAAASALKDIGYEGTDAMLRDAEAFRQDILRAYKAVQANMPVYGLRNGTFVPGYPGQLLPGPTGPFFPGEDGNRSWCYDVELGAHHLIPQGVLPADGPDAAWIMDHMEDVQFLAEGWFDFPAAESRKDPFDLGGFSKVQPYYTRNGEIDAMRDDVKPFVRTYFNTMASLIGLENLCFQEHFHGVGAWNKTHETGYFLQQTRFMLVMEYGDELWLAPLVTSNWFKDGMVIAVKNAPTRFGPVGYRIQSSVGRGFIEATIDPPTRSSPKQLVLRLRHPEGRPIRAVTVNEKEHRDFDAAKECIRLEPAKETIRVKVTY